MPAVRKSKEKYELIKQEVEICKRLASNDLKIRRKGISRLKKFLNNVDNETGKYTFIYYYFYIVNLPTRFMNLFLYLLFLPYLS